MDFTRLTPDREPADILVELIERHGLDKCMQAYSNYLEANHKTSYLIRFETDEITAKHLAHSIIDATEIDEQYHINDTPAIETILVNFLKEWK